MTGKKVLKILQDMCKKQDVTVIIVTHNSAITPIADKVIKLHDGKVSEIKINENPKNIEELEW